jgi:hypothetical protein
VDRRIVIVIAALLIAGAAGLFVLLQEQGDYTKVIVLTMQVKKDGVAPVSEEIRYGHAPATGLIFGAFQGMFTDKSGEVVQEFGIHDPRVRFGDRVSGTGEGDGTISGVTVMADEADLLVIAPYTGKEEKFALTDTATGKTLVTTDLAPAVAEFESTYPEDPGTSSYEQGGKNPVEIPVALGGALLVLLLIAVFILMIRRK